MIHVPSKAEIAAAVSRAIDVPRILELHPSARARCCELLEEARDAHVPFVIACGLRTPVQQRIEYMKGRHVIGDDPRLWEPIDPHGKGIVTHALPWQSWHQYGLAFDIALLKPDGKMVHWDEVADYDADGHADWLEVVEIAESLELLAGFRWKSKKHDGPHFEYHPGLELAAAREMSVGKIIPDDFFEKVT